MVEFDPVFVALDRYRTAQRACAQVVESPHCQGTAAAMSEEELDAAAAPWLAALEALFETTPTTLPGLRAFAEVFAHEEFKAMEPLGLPTLAIGTLLRSIDLVTRTQSPS